MPNIVGTLVETLRRIRVTVGKLAHAESHQEARMPVQEESPVPPWIKYPGHDPWWGGWRQGVSEAWLLDVWLPFWKALSPEEKERYLQTWSPPNDDWREYVTEKWT
jgi:hypothetical protein